MVGDQQGYDEFCREFAARPGEPHDQYAALNMARLVIGQPGTVEAEKVLEWATYAVEKTPNALFPNYVLSLAQYRAGRYEDLINGLSAIIKTHPLTEVQDHVNPQTALVLAMAHHRLGHSEDAQDI